MDNYPFECDACNYEGNFKSPQVYKMAIRLHKKKCKKTGRTEKGSVLDEVARRMRDFQQANPNRATFLPQGESAPSRNQTGLDGEIANIRLSQEESARLQADIKRQRFEAYADEEEGERGESPDSACSADCDDCCCAGTPPPCPEVGCRCPSCDPKAYSADCKKNIPAHLQVLMGILMGDEEGERGESPDEEYNRRCDAGEAKCEVCDKWDKALKMNYDDDTGFHLCVGCDD